MRAFIAPVVALAVSACAPLERGVECADRWREHDVALAENDAETARARATALVAGGCTAATDLAPVVPAPECEARPNVGGDPLDVPAFSLIGDGLTAGDVELRLSLEDPTLEVWLDCAPLGAASVVDVSGLPPGEHEIVVGRLGDDIATASATFVRGHAVYVATTVDWESGDASDAALAEAQRLHDAHDELVLTQLLGPYTFTSGLGDEREDAIVSFLRDHQATFGDEVGLHIHARCSFVEDAGVPCRTEPSFTGPLPDETGYAVPLASYTMQEQATLFEHAKDLFAEHGLAAPTSFRAGGWAADELTLRALANAGFVVDTSAHNLSRIEEWQQTEPFTSLYRWHAEHWSDIDDLSQPYWPSEDDAQVERAPFAGVLEVPDNASLVDYVDAREMTEIFYATWLGLDDDRPRVFSIGYHAQGFGGVEAQRMQDALTLLDNYRASNGEGPVVYARLSDLALAFPRP